MSEAKFSMPLTDQQQKTIIQFLHHVTPCHYRECFDNLAGAFGLKPQELGHEFYKISEFLPLDLQEDTVVEVARIAGSRRKLPQYKWVIGDNLDDKQLRRMGGRIGRLCLKFSIESGSRGDEIIMKFMRDWCDERARSYGRDRSFDPGRRSRIYVDSVVRLITMGKWRADAHN